MSIKRIAKDGSLVGPGEPGYDAIDIDDLREVVDELRIEVDRLDVEDLRAVVVDLISAVGDLQRRVADLHHQGNIWPGNGERFGENRQNLET